VSEVSVVQIAAHPIQVRIVQLVIGRGIDDLSLREIGEQIGCPGSPQQVKHHLQQLVKYGFLDIVGGQYRLGSTMRVEGVRSNGKKKRAPRSAN